MAFEGCYYRLLVSPRFPGLSWGIFNLCFFVFFFVPFIFVLFLRFFLLLFPDFPNFSFFKRRRFYVSVPDFLIFLTFIS